jgi:AcrR family transcriptional regulator
MAAARTRARTSAKAPARAARKRARLEVDERREQLLTIGLEAFATSAYDVVSIDDVARAAHVSKGLLYHYFPTKRAFYAAVVERAASQLLERTDIPPTLPPGERLRTSLEAYLAFVSAHGKT